LNGDNRQNGLDLFDLRAFLAIYSTQAKKIAKLAKQVNGMANRMHRIAL
jgi:N-acetylglucosamine kinase-like BadF-type ATPase